ncbi:MAG: tyrosine--tRNA ligase [Vampirovibrionales bacterium]|jgi:tyrosyl-tRNA synthetase|nr:tyrosine--tRNA ligase [Vampirovibrionales bacterium]
MTQATPQKTLHPEFLAQAKFLVQGAELLPASVEQLALRLQTAIETGVPLRIKLGLDPTRPDLHLGHAVVLKKLRMFQDLGHQAVMIIGDATAMVGDPSGRNKTRPPLSEEDVQINAQTYLEQAGKVIKLDTVEIVRNSTFFNAMGLNNLLQLMAQVTVAQILTREDFNKRYTENTPIALHEFLYPLMQAYDSVMVKADLELGGTDQRFNNLLGREMQVAYAKLKGEDVSKLNPQMVLLLPLLEGTDGKVKMSKSYPEHCINFTDTAEDMFGKLMSIPDDLILRYETLLSILPPDQLQQHAMLLEDPVKHGINPRDIKAGMAKYIVAQYHDAQAAEASEKGFVDRFRNKELPTDMPEATLDAGQAYTIIDLIAQHELAASKSEAKRLVQGGGVKLNGTDKLSDVDATLTLNAGESVILQVGKRKFIRFTA